MVAEISAQTRRLAEFLSAAASTPLPPEVLHKTKHHVIDTIAAMVSGAELPPGKRGLAYVADVADGASVLIGGGRAAPVEAALANGMSAHADETDDSHARSISHPAAPSSQPPWPSAICAAAAGSRCCAPSPRADVGTRVVLSLGKPVLNTDSSGRSTHAYCGLFGAAATASTLYGFTEEQARHALSYAAQSASG